MNINNHTLQKLYFRIDKRVNRFLKQQHKGEKVGNNVSKVEFDIHSVSMRCSLLAQYIMKRVDFENIYEKRKTTFERLYETFYGNGFLEPLEFLNSGKERCIFGFPILTSQRKKIIGHLKGRKIATFTFGDTLYQEENLGNNSDEMRLSREMFFVPIHQDLNDLKISYLSECLKEIIISSA
ncbi:hypothetical protein ACFL9T_20150 [Thermodesulfobacteriota bacterium]